MKNQKLKELTKAEEQIMHALWSIGKGFAKDIHDQLKQPRPAYNTVLTVIRVLCEKGFIAYNTYGKSNEYYTTISKEKYSSQKLNTLKKNYFNNSNAELVSFFMKDSQLNLEEIDEILKTIKSLKQK